MWINPKYKLPEVDQEIWVLRKHWKNRGIQSCEIIGCKVFKGADGSLLAENNDDIGCGTIWIILRNLKDSSFDTATAWAPKESIPVPEWDTP